MRGDATFCHDVDFGPASVWGVQRYFEEQLEFFDRWLPDDATGQPDGEAPVRIFVMGGGSGRRRDDDRDRHGAVRHEAVARLVSRGAAGRPARRTRLRPLCVGRAASAGMVAGQAECPAHALLDGRGVRGIRGR